MPEVVSLCTLKRVLSLASQKSQKGIRSDLVVGTSHPSLQNTRGDVEMKTEIKEASKRGDVAATGDFNYSNTDCLQLCSSHEKEIKFLDTLYCDSTPTLYTT